MHVLLRILGVLAFLGTACLGVTLLGLLAHALASGRRRRAARAGVAWLGLLAVYAAVLVAYGLGGRERSLALGEEKYLCAADCDLAFSVASVERDPPALAARPGRRLWRVGVRVRSDAARITMKLSGARVRVFDPHGRAFAPDAAASRTLEPGLDLAEPFARELAPGESYVVPLVFDLPAEVEHPRLLITEGGWVTRLIPGDENAPLHPKTLFRLT